jgi:hypothetical protein
MTGTVLRGSVKVNDVLEVVSVGESKKVKSMQMFHKSVDNAMQVIYYNTHTSFCYKTENVLLYFREID